MLKENESIFRKLMIAGDAILVSASFFLAYYFRDFFALLNSEAIPPKIYPLSTYLNLVPIITLLWVGCLHFMGSYQSFRTKTDREILWDIGKAFFISSFLFSGFAFTLKLHYLSRVFTVCIFTISWLILSFQRIVLMHTLRYLRKKGYNYRQMLLVGTGNRAKAFLSMIAEHPEWGFRITGLIDEDPTLKGKVIAEHKVLGTFEDIPKILNQKVIDEVVFIVPRSWLGRIEEPILYCEEIGKRVSVAVDLFNLEIAKAKQSYLENIPILTFETTPDKIWQLLIKRVLDILFSCLAILLLAPFFLIVTIIIKSVSPGPVIFKQTRCSLNGRKFVLYKFRTMIPDAEAKLSTLRQYNEMTGPAFKMSNDPRLIRFGKWLRKFSIDEFPQFFNVLQGHMSIVGPRPPIPAEVQKYKPWQRRRLSMRPGISGLWQVEGRSKAVNFEEWMKKDLYYIDHWSLWLDLVIFLKTIPTVLFGIGAK